MPLLLFCLDKLCFTKIIRFSFREVYAAMVFVFSQSGRKSSLFSFALIFASALVSILDT